MKTGSKEFYEVMESFESNARTIDGAYIYDLERCERPPGESFIAGWYYNNGNTNAAFNAYLRGYQHAKCLARLHALPLHE